MKARFAVSVLALVLGGCAHQPDSLRVVSALGMRQVLLDVVPRFERKTRTTVSTSFHSGAVIAERLKAGETADVVLLPTAIVNRLVADGRLMPQSAAEIAIARVGVAVRKGAPHPDISSVTAFRTAMLQARSIACPDPRLGGSSGLHIARMFERLGIAEAVKPKLVFASTPDVPGTLPGDIVARGDAEVALHQMQELLAVPGVELAGPLPDDLQARLGFSVAIVYGTPRLAIAQAFVDDLRSSRTSAVISRKGMEPAIR